MVPKAGRFYGWTFLTERGVTHGDPVYLTVFNIVVDTLVRVVLLELCGPQESHHGLRWSVGEQTIVFYVKNARIEGSKTI